MRYVTKSAYETTTDYVEQPRPACENDPEAFDLDVLGKDVQAVDDAVQTCLRCPLYWDCRDRTLAGPKPIGLVQGGVVWREKDQKDRKYRRKAAVK